MNKALSRCRGELLLDGQDDSQPALSLYLRLCLSLPVFVLVVFLA